MRIGLDDLLSVSGLAAAYAAGLHAVARVFELVENEEAAKWIRALGESHLVTVNTDWGDAATEFWRTTDSNKLMSAYHRGLPGQLLAALQEDVRGRLQREDDQWLAELSEKAQAHCAELIKDLAPPEFDNQRVHRLQAFPSIIAAQALPLVHTDETRYKICAGVARILKRSQERDHGFTESGADQVNQIVPQVMTDQLIAGPSSWNRSLWSRPVLERLFHLGLKTSPRFETGLALSIQFLLYYRASLESKVKRKYFPEDCKLQSKLIDQYLDELQKMDNAIVASILPWLAAIQEHVGKALKSAEPFRSLIRQSSAVVIAYRSGALHLDVPLRLYELCVLNNLRAARRSFNLPDEADRLRRVHDFFVANGVSREIGERVVEHHFHEEPSVCGKMQDLVATLDQESDIPPTSGRETYASARGHTLDELQKSRERIARRKQARRSLSRAAAIPGIDQSAEIAVDTVWPIIEGIVRWSCKSQRNTKNLRRLINISVAENLEEGLQLGGQKP